MTYPRRLYSRPRPGLRPGLPPYRAPRRLVPSPAPAVFTVDPATLVLTGVDIAFGGSAAAAFTVDPASLVLTGVDVAFAGSGAAAIPVDSGQIVLSGIDVGFAPSTAAPLPVDPAVLALSGVDVATGGTGIAAAVVDPATLLLTSVDVVMGGTGAAPIGRVVFAVNDLGNVSTPDHADFAITDLDFELTFRMESWAPGTAKLLAWQSGIIGDSGWYLEILGDGKLQVRSSPDGSVGAEITTTTTTAPSLSPNTKHAIRWQYDPTSGADRVCTFLVDGSTFETVTVPGGATSIHNSGQLVRIGPLFVAGFGYDAEIDSAVWRASIGGSVIANPDFNAQSTGTTSFADTAPTPKTWTVTAPGWVASELVGRLALSGVDVAFGGSGAAAVTIDPGILVLSGVDPTISLAAGLNIDPGVLALSGITPTLAGAGVGSWAVDPGILALSGVTPAFAGSGAVAAAVDPAVLSLSGVDPTFAGTSAALLAVDPAPLVLSGVDVDFASEAGGLIVNSATLLLSAPDVAFAGVGVAPLPVDPAMLTVAGVDVTFDGSGATSWAIDPAVLLLTGGDVAASLPVVVLVDPAVLVLSGVDITLTTEEAPIPPWTILRAVAWAVELEGIGPESELVAYGQGGLVEHTLKIGDVRTLRYALRRNLTGVISVTFRVTDDVGGPLIISRVGAIIDVPEGLVDLNVLAGDYGTGLLEMSQRYPRRRPFYLEALTGPTPVTHPNRGQEILWLEPTVA